MYVCENITKIILSDTCLLVVILRDNSCSNQVSGGYHNSLDGFTHVQAHFDTVLGMFRQRDRQPRHTVVAVSKDLYSHAFILLWGSKMSL